MGHFALSVCLHYNSLPFNYNLYKNNFTEIHISRPTPLYSLSVSLLFIALSYHCHSEIMTESCEVFVTFESFKQILEEN